MTVIDTSGVVDFLLGVGAAEQVESLMAGEGELAAPDLLVFEVLAVLRREALRGVLAEARAADEATSLKYPLEAAPVEDATVESLKDDEVDVSSVNTFGRTKARTTARSAPTAPITAAAIAPLDVMSPTPGRRNRLRPVCVWRLRTRP